ncbi:hypothetical protein PP336_14515 [Mycobacteroides abscessus]|uniref:hypothetical protein n=1 Tax=Mycobacteroides abscessus TaxID=36809 RepID=UPI00078C19BC|nr:hypothetical protein [Mycobacteroides abscessus]QSM04191.1 hypothetical protein PROPHIGD51-2_53 [Mycobacterium phage prophiGD51-2]AMU55776.1 hypothetical protein A3O02_11815 [Mycobacteroides abscessus]MBE5436464.1 hypothetical protein [Mycobacteroides abscessus]MBN7447550.1 hypothetical protein [Mycobacteroides abscessus subsp. abscessus]MDM1901622.1 hypothetical protein [Mycobacteroides abscessus]
MSVKNKHFRAHARRCAAAAIELLDDRNCCQRCQLTAAEAVVVAHEAKVRYLTAAGLQREVDQLRADPVLRFALRELSAAECDGDSYLFTAGYLREAVSLRWDEVTLRAGELARAEAPVVAA